MYCLRRTEPMAQRGVALIIALLVAALAAALLVALQRDFDLSYRRAANEFIGEQSWAYLVGAEALAIRALQLDYDGDLARGVARDDLEEIWAQEPVPYALDEGGWMLGSLEDLQGRFNLNLLAAAPGTGEGAAAYVPAQQFFIRLLQALEGLEINEFQAMAITDAIGDWIDADDIVRRNGAESSSYLSRTPAYAAANQAMASVSELRAIEGISIEIYEALRPFVTVWPREASSINIHTAPATVLRAVNSDGNLQPLTIDHGESLVQLREDSGFIDMDDFFQQGPFAGNQLDAVASLLTESSSYFLLTSRVEIADREQRLYSVLRRSERQVDVLARTGASLYDFPGNTIPTTSTTESQP